MIITCHKCKKQFRIDIALIPINGRDLKCGSCDYVWFYKLEKKKSESLALSENIINNEDKSAMFEEEKEQIIEEKQSLSQNKIEIKKDKKDEKVIEKHITTNSNIKESDGSKFFSYLIVSIISFVALIILLDTLKIPLIKVFPDLEIILFNLFEILKDIRLFIIDLY